MSIQLSHARFPTIPPDFETLDSEEKLDVLSKAVLALTRELSRYVYIPNEFGESVVGSSDFDIQKITKLIDGDKIVEILNTAISSSTDTRLSSFFRRAYLKWAWWLGFSSASATSSHAQFGISQAGSVNPLPVRLSSGITIMAYNAQATGVGELVYVDKLEKSILWSGYSHPLGWYIVAIPGKGF